MMNLSPDQHAELARFPTILRDLVLTELAAGNAIEDIGHSFPAPPVGAYVRLTRTLTTRAAASAPGLDFRARNSALSSGEFTDAQRQFFVLLPPVPEPELPSMDAIRSAHAPTDQWPGDDGSPDQLADRGRLAPHSSSPSPMPAPNDLDSVEAIQQAIVDALKRGAHFSRADKEGGSALVWRAGRFVRSDWGERPSEACCTAEADLWPMLRAFCYWPLWLAQQGRPLSELDSWRVIWRSMSPP